MDYTKLKQRLAKGPTEATWEASLGNGQTIRTPGLGHHSDCKDVCEQALAAIEQLEAHNTALLAAAIADTEKLAAQEAALRDLTTPFDG